MSRGLTARCSAACLALALGASPSTAQRLPELRLAAPVRFPEPFTNIRGLVELPDGRVLVSDPTEGSVWALDFSRRTRRDLGRRGEGPGEYLEPDRLWPFE